MNKIMQRLAFAITLCINILSSPALSQSLPPASNMENCPVSVVNPSYQVGWFHNQPRRTLQQDLVWPDAPNGPSFDNSGQGPDIGTNFGDAPNLVPPPTGYFLYEPYGNTARVSQSVSSVDQAYQEGRMVTYHVRTSSSLSARAIDGIGYGINPFVSDVVSGTYRISILISADNFSTATLLSSDALVETNVSSYTYTKVPSVNKIILQPSTVYSFRVIFHDASQNAIMQWDDFQIATGSCPTADLQVTKTNTPGVNGNLDQDDDMVAAGTVNYTITARNNGPTSVNGAVLTDTAISGLTCTTANCSGSACSKPSFTYNELAAGVTLGTLAAGSEVTLSLQCQTD